MAVPGVIPRANLRTFEACGGSAVSAEGVGSVTKWWSRQPDPFDVDPTWAGPFDTEAEALASLLVPPGEHWGGNVHEHPDDFDPWAASPMSVAGEKTPDGEVRAGIEALEQADRLPFLSEGYVHQAQVAATAFRSAATMLAGTDDERLAVAEKTAAGLELFLAQPWPDDPSQVETRDVIPADEQTRRIGPVRWTEEDRVDFLRRTLGPDTTDEAIARVRQGEWTDDAIDIALSAGG